MSTLKPLRKPRSKRSKVGTSLGWEKTSMKSSTSASSTSMTSSNVTMWLPMSECWFWSSSQSPISEGRSTERSESESMTIVWNSVSRSASMLSISGSESQRIIGAAMALMAIFSEPSPETSNVCCKWKIQRELQTRSHQWSSLQKCWNFTKDKTVAFKWQ